MNDEESLESYLHAKDVDLAGIKRRLVKSARKTDYRITDSHLLLQVEMAFSKIESVPEVFTKGLPLISDQFIGEDNKRLFVLNDMQTSYQELLTYLTPLVLQAGKLFTSLKPGDDPKTFFHDFILPNNRYTAILSERIPKINSYIENDGGLYDLHIHLNGSLETDTVWQDFLADPDYVRREIKKAFDKKEKVKQQFEQESTLFEPQKYQRLLRIAQHLREVFYNSVYPRGKSQPPPKLTYLIQEVDNGKTNYDYRHPFLYVIDEDQSEKFVHLPSVECLMYILILDKLKERGDETLAGLFHFYLLILGLTNRFLVQQVHQHGFEQFQKITVNSFRQASEKTYFRRFFQFHGNNLCHLKFLEGRFAPKKDGTELLKMTSEIFSGWESFQNEVINQKYKVPKPITESTLKLIAHYIKEADRDLDEYIRHKSLRGRLVGESRAISNLLEGSGKFKDKLTGLDAASSEFDTPPEVFAPAFRMVKKSTIPKRTFHAGEDFYHLISGLRAIFEAITFCGLEENDRIGHATATGISASEWCNLLGKKMLIPQGEYLDNLVFCRYLINSKQLTTLLPAIKKIETEILDLLLKIYGKNHSIDDYEASWLMRDICPVHANYDNYLQASQSKHFNQNEWDYIESKTDRKSTAFLLFQKYHELPYRKKYEMITEIETEGIFDRDKITKLQLDILKMMCEKGIIIETLPTSNVRIGIHKDFSTYHFFRWIQWEREGYPIPKIVLGSDDTGIFATNIYNEYANIYGHLNEQKHCTEADRDQIMDKLYKNSQQFKFS
ncbi:hypothetical protein [Pedobacter sp. MC2016-24]|uniref:hypothetical protein n=1 Tax=Pedobacter sp. MC2016-24 TaxID=2780090 RepID=UPI00188082F1|nr:hypothetical protein [Pedobacter sp. MC2016-24]MBE9603136.1 hypothetical protein [Pedobacter sp. MC2016-24]